MVLQDFGLHENLGSSGCCPDPEFAEFGGHAPSHHYSHLWQDHQNFQARPLVIESESQGVDSYQVGWRLQLGWRENWVKRRVDWKWTTAHSCLSLFAMQK